MYEKMFQALEPGSGGEASGLASRGGKKTEEVFNSTQMSFGKEIEQMQKQLQDEMQSRIQELEQILKLREQELQDYQKVSSTKYQTLLENTQQVNAQN